MLECSDCGTKNTTGASMCVTCGNKRLLTESGEVYEPPSEGELPPLPTWHEAWREFADRVGGAYSLEGQKKIGPVKLFGEHKVRTQIDDWTISLDTQDSGEDQHTVMSAQYTSLVPLTFHAYRRNALDDFLRRFLPLQDIEVDSPEFDEIFLLKGSDEARVRDLFSNSLLRSRLQENERLYLESDGQALVFEEVGFISDVSLLVDVHELFVETLRELQRLELIE